MPQAALPPVFGSSSSNTKSFIPDRISFQPADPAKSRGSGGTIRDGRYEVPAAHGLPPGRYLVTIEANRLTGRMMPDPTGTAPSGSPLYGALQGRFLDSVTPANYLQFDVPLAAIAAKVPDADPKGGAIEVELVGIPVMPAGGTAPIVYALSNTQATY